MSWQTPGKDEPDAPEPAVPPPPETTEPPEPPEADAETTRVPVEPATPPPAAGLISAQPVGWNDPNAGAPASAPQTPDGPAVAWAPPVRAAAQVVDGLVIAGTFTRLVAYAIDTLFLGMVNLSALGAIGAFSTDRDDSLDLAVGIAFVIVDGLYFIGLWTSGWRATLGMRLLGLRVLAATTATTLSRNDALLRWIALSGAVAILALIPSVAGTLGLISGLWVLVLLITTATNPLHQGLHDRWARSVVVQPAPGGSGAAIATCLVLVVLLFLVVPIALLAFVGPQLEDIIRQIGESV